MLQFLWTAVSVKNRKLLSVLCVPGRGSSPSAELPPGNVKGNLFPFISRGPLPRVPVPAGPEPPSPAASLGQLPLPPGAWSWEYCQPGDRQGGQPGDRQGCQHKDKAGLSHYVSKGVKSKAHQC